MSGVARGRHIQAAERPAERTLVRCAGGCPRPDTSKLLIAAGDLTPTTGPRRVKPQDRVHFDPLSGHVRSARARTCSSWRFEYERLRPTHGAARRLGPLTLAAHLPAVTMLVSDRLRAHSSRGPPTSTPGRSRTRQARLTTPWTKARCLLHHRYWTGSARACAAFRCGPTPRGSASPAVVTLTERVEADSGEPDDWSFLRRPALLGFVAVMSICLGASLAELALQARDGGHLVLRRGRPGRRPR